MKIVRLRCCVGQDIQHENEGGAVNVGVVQFPGSLDDRDAAWAFRLLGAEAQLLWHQDRSLDQVIDDALTVPTGLLEGVRSDRSHRRR